MDCVEAFGLKESKIMQYVNLAVTVGYHLLLSRAISLWPLALSILFLEHGTWNMQLETWNMHYDRLSVNSSVPRST
jgi:hypothetical protein